MKLDLERRSQPGPGRAGAVALRYDRESDRAPAVVAKGRGEVADRILALARESGVPVHADRDLLQLLTACEIGDEIPAELYTVVAEVLHHLWRLNASQAGA